MCYVFGEQMKNSEYFPPSKSHPMPHYRWGFHIFHIFNALDSDVICNSGLCVNNIVAINVNNLCTTISTFFSILRASTPRMLKSEIVIRKVSSRQHAMSGNGEGIVIAGRSALCLSFLSWNIRNYFHAHVASFSALDKSLILFRHQSCIFSHDCIMITIVIPELKNRNNEGRQRCKKLSSIHSFEPEWCFEESLEKCRVYLYFKCSSEGRNKFQIHRQC